MDAADISGVNQSATSRWYSLIIWVLSRVAGSCYQAAPELSGQGMAGIPMAVQDAYFPCPATEYMNRSSNRKHLLKPDILLTAAVLFMLGGCGGDGNYTPATSTTSGVPADIQTVIGKPLYSHATWELRVADPANGKVLIDLNSDVQFFIGSV